MRRRRGILAAKRRVSCASNSRLMSLLHRTLLLGLLGWLALVTPSMAQVGKRLPAQQPATAVELDQWWKLRNAARPKTPDRINRTTGYVKITPRGDQSDQPVGLRTVPVAAAPPPPKLDTPYPPTDPMDQWIPGQWHAVGGTWAWSQGHYERPTNPGYVWVPGTWSSSPWGYSEAVGRWVDPYARDPATNPTLAPSAPPASVR